jgi:hypothetical protein
MAAKYTFPEILKRLRESPGSITCAELKKMLEDLGFVVTKGTKGNHHRYMHPSLKGFFGGKFDCGHKATLKPFYPKDVLGTLIELENELREAGAIK